MRVNQSTRAPCRAPRCAILRALLQFHIGLDRRQRVGQIGTVLFRFQLGAHGLGTAKDSSATLSRLRISPPGHPGPAAGPARSSPHPGHPGNVVHLVAHQGQKVDDQRGRDTKFVLHARLIHHRVGHGIHQGGVRFTNWAMSLSPVEITTCRPAHSPAGPAYRSRRLPPPPARR